MMWEEHEVKGGIERRREEERMEKVGGNRKTGCMEAAGEEGAIQ